tara:strand:- start:23697 stop:23945 length:249 start_codon:yes stop_codon:yes gene_type:complete
MKLEQGYGTIQDDYRGMGYVLKDGNLVLERVEFERGTRLFAVVERDEKTRKISSSLRNDDTTQRVRVNGNVFDKNNKVRLVK